MNDRKTLENNKRRPGERRLSKGVRLTYFPCSMTEPFYRYNLLNNSWLGMRFTERELYNKTPNEANIERLKDLLEDE